MKINKIISEIILITFFFPRNIHPNGIARINAIHEDLLAERIMDTKIIAVKAIKINLTHIFLNLRKQIQVTRGSKLTRYAAKSVGTVKGPFTRPRITGVRPLKKSHPVKYWNMPSIPTRLAETINTMTIFLRNFLSAFSAAMKKIRRYSVVLSIKCLKLSA